MEAGPVLEVCDLSIDYPLPSQWVRAVDHVNLTVGTNEIVGLIGESGCGKSTLAYGIMRLLAGGARVATGSVRVAGKDLYAMDREQLRQFRWRTVSMVFQSAMNALNPVMTIEEQIADTISSHEQATREELHVRAEELCRLVRIDPRHLRSYPHQLSGGMRQRVIIAMAIALKPRLVIMDEPTTALDVVVQRSIMDQIIALKDSLGFSVLIISHDISLIADLSDRVAVMYAGRIIESANAESLRGSERHHPYTEGLMRAIPKLTGSRILLESIPGHPPDLREPVVGCWFRDRCVHAMDICSTREPSDLQLGSTTVRCYLMGDDSA